MKFRLAHKLYARFFGYFWLPCPMCNNFFGGHEKRDRSVFIYHNGKKHPVCPRCTSKAISENIARWHTDFQTYAASNKKRR